MHRFRVWAPRPSRVDVVVDGRRGFVLPPDTVAIVDGGTQEGKP